MQQVEMAVATYGANGSLTVLKSDTVAGPSTHEVRARLGRGPNYLIWGLTAATALLGVTDNSFAAQTCISKDYSETSLAFYESIICRSSMVPTHLESALKEMNGYRHLQAGWDGIGSITPKSSIIDDATTFLLMMPNGVPSPEASVSADGAVSWFWKTRYAYATVSFNRSGRFAYYAKSHATGERVKGAGPITGGVPQELIDMIHGA